MPGIMYQAAQLPCQGFSQWTGAKHRRSLGASPGVPLRTRLEPVAKALTGTGIFEDFFLGRVGVQPPQVSGILKGHRVIDDFHPYR